MGYGTDGLTFNTLRGGNKARLPQFKTKQGKPAHSKPDGSDWTPAQWAQALLGELGEWAKERVAFDQGSVSYGHFAKTNAAELPDIQIYLDILALRSLDVCTAIEDPAFLLLKVIAELGTYANARKKFERGDYDNIALLAEGRPALIMALQHLNLLFERMTQPALQYVTHATESGVDLGRATIEKFNAVSVRVGSDVRLAADDWHHELLPEQPAP